MHSVGLRYPVAVKVCESGGSSEEVMRACVELVRPGYVYEVRYTLTGSVSGREGLLYEVLRQVESTYPGIGVNYVGVSGDGREVVFQVFDPPGISGIVVALVVVAIAVAIFSVFAYLSVERVVVLLSGFPPAPEPVRAAFWTAVAVAVAGVGAYLVSRAIRGRA